MHAVWTWMMIARIPHVGRVEAARTLELLHTRAVASTAIPEGGKTPRVRWIILTTVAISRVGLLTRVQTKVYYHSVAIAHQVSNTTSQILIALSMSAQLLALKKQRFVVDGIWKESGHLV